MKKLIFILCLLSAAFAVESCKPEHQKPPWEEPEPEPQPGPQPAGEKEKMIWLDAEANFLNFSTREKVEALLDKIKETGFNKIVVDVHPVVGEVLYDSDFMPEIGNTFGGHTIAPRDWDYLQFFIDEARERDLKISVSVCVFTAGEIATRKGPAWTDPKMKEWACVEYTPDQGLISIKNDNTKAGQAGGFVFLNPVLPEVQEYVLSFIREIVTKYDFDSFTLDFCRYPDRESDFSEASRVAFNQYLGRGGGGSISAANWPEEVFTYASTEPNADFVPGTYFKEWWAFRATVIRDFVAKVRTEIRTLKPDVTLEYWAASWWNGISWHNGQNWANTSYNALADPYAGAFWYARWFTPAFQNTGFADQLDTFLLGSYLTDVYMGNTGPDGYVDLVPEEPDVWPFQGASSMEYAIDRAKRLVGNSCKLYGTIGTGLPSYPPAVTEEEAWYCLKHTQGLMVFDIVYVIRDDLWDELKRAIDRAEAQDNES
jgi:uncharacterized lipoprotein YddW (UPF0748 family)